MSLLKDMREKADRAAQRRDRQLARARESVSEAISSDTFILTALNHMGESESKEALQKLATSVTESVTRAVCDPVVEFIDICKARGKKESQIRYIVRIINEAFCIVSKDASYDEMLSAVATYLQEKPSLYDDLDII